MTLMIANISPSSGSVEHTLNTLRYAYRVKELRGASIPKRQIAQPKHSPKIEESSSDPSSADSSVAAVVAGMSLSPVSSSLESLTPDLDALAKKHDALIGTILAEEEELIATHRKALEVFVQMLNEEMTQVNLIDQPGSDVDVYVSYMDENLRQKEELLKAMRTKLDRFKHHLLEEERMSQLFESNRQLPRLEAKTP
jgi:kinesin family protein 2/24